MTDDEFEDLGRRRSEAEFEVEQAHKRFDDYIDSWRSSGQSEEAALATLNEARKGGHAATRQLLACMYSLAPQLKAGGLLNSRLFNVIDQLPEQSQRKRRWLPKDGYDVALTYALGLARKNASTKSNWRRTLTQAQGEGVPSTEEDFLAWIVQVGGEEKARRPEKRKPIDIPAEAEAFQVPGTTEGALKLKIPPDRDLPGGMCVALLKEVGREGQDRLVHPVEVLTDDRSVASVLLKVKRQWAAVTCREMNKLGRERERERKRQERIDEEGDRPLKRKRPKKRRGPTPSLKVRRRSSGPTIIDFLSEDGPHSVKQSKL